MESMEIGQFYKDKRVLVTGHTGFKGTWMLMMLEHFGAKTAGFAHTAGKEDLFSLVSPKLCLNVEGDINDKEKLNNLLESFQPEIVFHLAAHSTLNQSHKITDYIFQTNAMGLVQLFEGIRTIRSVKSIVVVTSDKSYKNLETQQPYTEKFPLGAQDPYSTSKACQELITECYQKSFFSGTEQNIAIATARASNVIGGGDFKQTRLIPSLLTAYINQQTAIIRNPQAIRPWQNVLDVLYGYLILGKKLYENGADSIYCSPFNFGPEPDGFITVEEVAVALSKLFKGAKFQVQDSSDAIIETNILKLSSEKAKKILEWNPKYSMKQTLTLTAEFCIRRNQGEDERNICEEYIHNYFEE